MRCKLVGIVNITPDSFSDGGQFLQVEAAIAQARRLVEQGAAVIDLGAESTRPGAIPVNPAEEWRRIKPVLEGLAGKIEAKISIDTRHAETARCALEGGADWVNDVSAAASDALLEVVAAYPSAHYVLMHSLSIPADPVQVLPEGVDGGGEVLSWAQQALKRLATFGIEKERVIFDPGIGFGKTAAQSRALLEGVAQFTALNVPLFIGHSRKSFLGLPKTATIAEKDAATLAVSTQLIKSECVNYLRVHNVALHSVRLSVSD